VRALAPYQIVLDLVAVLSGDLRRQVVGTRSPVLIRIDDPDLRKARRGWLNFVPEVIEVIVDIVDHRRAESPGQTQDVSVGAVDIDLVVRLEDAAAGIPRRYAAAGGKRRLLVVLVVRVPGEERHSVAYRPIQPAGRQQFIERA